MYFLVSFTTAWERPVAYGLAFLPGPVWVRADPGEEAEGREGLLVNMARGDTESYDWVGELLPVLEARGTTRGWIGKSVVVVVHETGHGWPDAVDRLTRSLTDHGFEATLIRQMRPLE